MTEQEAKGFIAVLMAVPDARRASISVEFIQYGEITPTRKFTACFFIGQICYLGNGATPEEAVVKSIHEWAKVPLRLVGEA